MKSKCPKIASYGIGYFVELAVFHVVAFIGTIAYTPFHMIILIYNILLLILSFFSGLYSYKKQLYSNNKFLKTHEKESWFTWLLILVVVITISIQVIRGFTYDISYMSYDDAEYTTYAEDALESNLVGLIDPYTGEGIKANYKRIVQSSLVFPAYISGLSGIPVTTVEHTIQYIQFVLLAYSIYYYMASELFANIESRLLFITIISVFYMFGYHSHYSLTFRLLGPNYQGKAVLAVSLTPLVFVILTKKLSEPFQWKVGFLLVLFSLAAVSLTLWGVGTMLVIIPIPVILSLFRKERQGKHLLYIFFGTVIPLGYLGYYVLAKYAI